MLDDMRDDTGPARDTRAGGDPLAIPGVLLRGWWIAAIFVICATTLGAWYAFGVAEPSYRATTTLAVETAAPPLPDIQSPNAGLPPEDIALNTEIEVLRSRGVLTRLADRPGIADHPRFPGGTGDRVEDLRRAIVARVKRGTRTIEIGVVTGDPALSRDIANGLAGLYVTAGVERKSEAIEQAVGWLSGRAQSLGADLLAREARLRALRERADLDGAEGIAASGIELERLLARLPEIRAEAARLEARLAGARDADADPVRVASILGDASLDRLAAGVATGEGRLRFDRRLSHVATATATALASLRADEAALAGRIEDLRRRAEARADTLDAIAQLERETEAVRVLHDSFVRRLKETTVQRGLQAPDAWILSEAVDGRRIAPLRGRITAMSALSGLVLAVIAILLRHRIWGGLRTAPELERETGLPVLGAILRDPAGGPSDEGRIGLRQLRTSLVMSRLPVSVIALTSPGPDGTRAGMAVGLADAFAETGRRVLLLAGDTGPEGLQPHLDLPWDEITLDPGEATPARRARRDPRHSFDVLALPADGNGGQSGANGWHGSDSGAIFDRLRGAYDTVIIDLPPVLIAAQTRALASHADAVLLSVSAGATPRRQVHAAIRQFGLVAMPLRGLVLTAAVPGGTGIRATLARHGITRAPVISAV
ncbi:hypothetical protein E2L08_02865 [Palleronia sediminis]|uniref:Polysaccharide chain length determinant N-terminal domain-containing protein n=1 Tax=Palleronia sediminis TaxID=2547833 RepID=A0A4R6AK93_9RHOB|nr:exopolysaccharide transport family protein [Palleronia sediminis]TDL83604.1 hypothetical protein E2L08_02865 [Palleronia sediminis]